MAGASSIHVRTVKAVGCNGCLQNQANIACPGRDLREARQKVVDRRSWTEVRSPGKNFFLLLIK